METKSDLRKKYLSLRAALPHHRREQASLLALKFLTQWVEDFLPDKGVLLSFAPFGDEIDLWPFNRWVLKEKTLALPRIDQRVLEVAPVNSLQTLKANLLGILEPTTQAIAKESVHAVLVPGIAFDSNMHRLGFGLGFYDKLLSHLPRSVPKIGIGFREQLTKEPLPAFDHDIPLTHRFLF